MSQLSRFLKPLVHKNVIRHNNKMVRLFSSIGIYPYVFIDHVLKVGTDYWDGPLDGMSVGDRENEILIKDKEFENEILVAMNIGYCQTYDRLKVWECSDNLIILSPCDPKLSPKEVELPSLPLRSQTLHSVPLPRLPLGSQIQNAAMFSWQREDQKNHSKDLAVVMKLSGSQLKFYKPSFIDHDFGTWVDIETINEAMSPFSSLMYSKKDQKFYIPSHGGEYLCSYDLKLKEKDKPEFIRLWTNPLPSSLPPSLLYSFQHLIPLTRTDHLVESPSGEQFLIKWYYKDDLKFFCRERFGHKTKRFIVFKEDGTSKDKKRKNMSYTENIGDLCIFLGRDEAFCLQASSCPGLRPNCIYFVGYNYGVFDITTQICTLFYTEEGPLRSNGFPYWPHPLSISPN